MSDPAQGGSSAVVTEPSGSKAPSRTETDVAAPSNTPQVVDRDGGPAGKADPANAKQSDLTKPDSPTRSSPVPMRFKQRRTPSQKPTTPKRPAKPRSIRKLAWSVFLVSVSCPMDRPTMTRKSPQPVDCSPQCRQGSRTPETQLSVKASVGKAEPANTKPEVSKETLSAAEPSQGKPADQTDDTAVSDGGRAACDESAQPGRREISST